MKEIGGLEDLATTPGTGATEAQVAILADRLVTDEEAQRALDAYVACLGERGVEVERIDLGDGVYGTQVLSPSDAEQQEALAQCRQWHWELVAMAQALQVARQNEPSAG